MKKQRRIFVLVLLAIFGVCYYIMNQRYDELARYPYANKDNREIILEHLDTEEINFLCNQKIKPNEFLPYIEIPGFDIHNALWYNKAKISRDQDNTFIVNFINTYKSKMDYLKLETLITNYPYEVLQNFYDEGDTYIKDASLIVNAGDISIKPSNKSTLYQYTPNDLVNITDIPHVNQISGKDNVQVRKELIDPLNKLCVGASEINGKTCGDLILVAGFISYDEQVDIYERSVLTHGVDNFMKYDDYPGRSESQSGYVVKFQVAGNSDDMTVDILQAQEQAKWLQENAHKYGFILRFPSDQEKVTGKLYQPYTLRYVGIENAKKMYKDTVLFEDMEWK